MGSDRGEDPPGKISEREIIREIFLRNTPPSTAFEIGPGDDSAVLRPIKGRAVVTTDMLVQDVHFDLSYIPPDHLGEKSILVNLSDIAAMGARPLAAFVAVGLPESVEAPFVRSFARGLKRVLRRYGVALGGGDTVRAEKCVISVTLLGVAGKSPVTRKGAKVGDHIYISGIPGLSHLGMLLLRRGAGRLRGGSRAERMAVARHLRPHVDIDLGCFLGDRSLANAMIDTSDGVFVDLGHMLEDAGAGATIDLSKVPVPEGVKALSLRLGHPWEDAALFGGEDYYLLFTISPEREKALAKWPEKDKLYRIGRIERRKGIHVKKRSGEVKLTRRARPFFEHFTAKGNEDH